MSQDLYNRALTTLSNGVGPRWTVEGSPPHTLHVIRAERPHILATLSLHLRRFTIMPTDGGPEEVSPVEAGVGWVERLCTLLVERLTSRRADPTSTAPTPLPPPPAVPEAPTAPRKAKPRHEIVDRVRKLLATARDQKGKPEGDAAARLALRAMSAHAIEESEVAAAERRGTIEERDYDTAEWADWRRALLGECGVHTGCIDGMDDATGVAYLYGPESMLDLAEYLFEIIEAGLEKEADKQRARWQAAQWVPMSTDRLNSHMVGWYRSAVAAIRQRLEHMRREEAQVDPKGTALVKLQSEDVHEWLQKQNVEVPSEIPEATDSYQFSRDGFDAGQRIPIHLGLGGPGKPEGKIPGKAQR